MPGDGRTYLVLKVLQIFSSKHISVCQPHPRTLRHRQRAPYNAPAPWMAFPSSLSFSATLFWSFLWFFVSLHHKMSTLGSSEFSRCEYSLQRYRGSIAHTYRPRAAYTFPFRGSMPSYTCSKSSSPLTTFHISTPSARSRRYFLSCF